MPLLQSLWTRRARGARGGTWRAVRRIATAGLFLAVATAALFVLAGTRVRHVEPVLPATGEPRFEKTIDAARFQKGNLHAHSNVSDGDSPPEDVYLWYRNHGYNFIALTDHNTRVDPALYKNLEREDFRILSGEEITMSGDGRQVHVNALCIDETISGGWFDTPRLALDHAVSEISKQGGVALINHPNFDFGLSADDVAETRGAELLEIWSGHPYVWTLGKDGRPSHERIWEIALSRGLDIAPAGVDDVHQLSAPTNDRKPANPGLAWVRVFADSPDPKVICARLRAGDLYASNGAELRRIAVDGKTIRVWPEDPEAKVELIDRDGVILDTQRPSLDGAVSYVLGGKETYVRARVTDSKGKLAWSPAYRVMPPR